MASKLKSKMPRTSGFSRRVGSVRGVRDSCSRGLIKIIRGQVRVAQGVHEIANAQVAHLRHHVGE